MNSIPSPPVLFVVSQLIWLLVPIAAVVLAAVAVGQLRSLNRNLERFLRTVSDRNDGKS